MDKQDINQIKKKLDEFATQKEAFFKDYKDKKKAVFVHVAKLKELRSSYNFSSLLLKELIKKRDDYNKKVRQAIQSIKEIENKKKEFLKNSKTKFDPSLAYQIERLEQKIETQALDFEKEKQIMKKINLLKKKYSQFSQLNLIIQDQRKLQTQIDQDKTQANSLHDQIRQLQRKNKLLKKDFINTSRQIMNLKKEQSQYFQKFIESKKEFIRLYNVLKSDKMINQARKRHAQDKIIEQKQRQLEEKIKNKQKITTEDLLVFQSR